MKRGEIFWHLRNAVPPFFKLKSAEVGRRPSETLKMFLLLKKLKSQLSMLSSGYLLFEQNSNP
jgi:hypothetical protein